MGLGARLQRQRNRRSIRPMQRLVAAGAALRPSHYPMVRARERADMHRDRPFVNRGRLIQHQPLDDLRRNQRVQRLQHQGLRRERSEGRLLAGNAAEKAVDFPMAAQAASQAVPAGPLPIRAKDGAEQRLHAARTYQRPRRSRLEPAPIDFPEVPVEVIVADDDGEAGTGGPHPGAALFELPDQPAVVAFDHDARLRQPSFDPARRCAERRPVGGPESVHAVFGGHDIAPGGERDDGRKHIGAGMVPLEGRDDLLVRVAGRRAAAADRGTACRAAAC